MGWTLFVLALFYCCSGVTSQAALSQPASMSVPLGERVKLSCLMSGSGGWQNWQSWYQQKPGQRPRPLMHDISAKVDGIPDRIAGSTSGSDTYLTINNVQPDDEGDYFCGNWHMSGRAFIFGGGTSLSVIGQPVTPPTVRVFPPSPEEITTKNTATLVCLIEGFYPASTNVAWSADGTDITRNVETAKPTKQGEKYVSSSYLTMTAPEYNSHDNFKCKVTHEGKTYEQSIKRS